MTRKIKELSWRPEVEAVRLTGECQIVEAKQAEGSEAPSLPSFMMKAYNGTTIDVGYWGKVLINLAGMKVSDSTPILYGHDRYDIRSLLGQSERVEIKDGKEVRASGTIMSDGTTARLIVGLARKGFKFQASVGVTPLKFEEVEAGETVEANGRTHKGPFIHITESELNELSVVALGADRKTESRIAAQLTPKQQEEIMGDKQTEKTAEAIRAEAVAEETRVQQIRVEAKDHPELKAKAISEEWSVDRTRLAVRDAVIAAQKSEIEASKVQGKRPDMPIIMIGNVKAEALNRKAVEAGAAIRTGLLEPEKHFDAEALNQGDDLHIHSLTDFVRATMALAGKRLEVSRHQTREFLQAAFSNRDIANILSNLANKFVMSAYGEIEQTWRVIASIRPVVDFKPNTGVRLVMANLLKQLAPNGEIQMGNISDETRTIQADTKALMLGITRKDIVNDDLAVLTDLPYRLGMAAARTLNADFWAEFEADTANRYKVSGDPVINRQTGGVLDLDNLATAQTLFRKLKDSDGNPIGVRASTLLVSAKNEVAADSLFNSQLLITGETKTKGNENTFRGKYRPAVSTYISDDPWYLVAPPNVIPAMEVAFLNGRQEPFVESADADFDQLGIKLRTYYDYGVAFAERRAIVRSNA